MSYAVSALSIQEIIHGNEENSSFIGNEFQ